MGRDQRVTAKKFSTLSVESIHYALSGWIEDLWECSTLPGITIGVRLPGARDLIQSVGFADLKSKRKLKPGDLFPIASQTKMFTSVIAHRLASRRELSLDRPVSDYLSSKKGHFKSSTLRDLLTHNSGMIRDGIGASFWSLKAPFPDKRKVLADSGTIFDSFRGEFKYSNVGYSLAGIVLEEIAGRSFTELINDEIIEPLALSNTSTERPLSAVTGYSAPNRNRELKPLVLPKSRAFTPAAGVFSSVPALLDFASALCFQSDTLLPNTAKRRAYKPHSHVNDLLDRGYGTGFFLRERRERSWVGHNGSHVGFNSVTWFDPKTGIVVSVMANASHGPALAVADGIIDLIELFLKSPPARVLRRFNGRFSNFWGRWMTLATKKKLLYLDTSLYRPLLTAQHLTPVGPGEFRDDGPGRVTAIGETVRISGVKGRRRLQTGSGVAEERRQFLPDRKRRRN